MLHTLGDYNKDSAMMIASHGGSAISTFRPELARTINYSSKNNGFNVINQNDSIGSIEQ